MLPAPCVYDEIILLTYMSQGTETHFPVILPVVFSFQHGIGKDERGICKVYSVFMRFSRYFCSSHSKPMPLSYTNVYTMSSTITIRSEGSLTTTDLQH